MLHALTCYYNSVGYDRLRNNLHRFVDTLKGCPLTVIELSYDGTWELENSIKILGKKPDNIMWQKERLLNIAAASLPPEVDKIAWIDADLHFANSNWAADAEKALENLSVVQLFSTARYLDANHQVFNSQPSIVGNHKKGDAVAPGGAWAARREVFPLHDNHILGGGDRLMWEAMRGTHHIKLEEGGWWRGRMSDRWLRNYMIEGERIRRRAQGRIGRIYGDVLHYWHGSFKNRQYVSRWDILKENEFDPEVDIAIDENGLWRWNSDKPDMHARVADYFTSRKEDVVEERPSKPIPESKMAKWKSRQKVIANG